MNSGSDTPAEPAPGSEDEPEAAPPASPEIAPAASPSEAPATGRPSLVDGEEHAVDPRSMTVARLVGMAWTCGIAVVQYIVILIVWAAGPISNRGLMALSAAGVVVFAAALALAYKWPELHHRHLRYRVDDRGVRIRRGVLWRKVISIPASRVQHTDVSQGPVQRRYQLATLTVYTAGTEGASISLEGLEQTAARRLRDHLLPDHVDER
jgi:hypothetical protein